jgi:hypothetical protein
MTCYVRWPFFVSVSPHLRFSVSFFPRVTVLVHLLEFESGEALSIR